MPGDDGVKRAKKVEKAQGAMRDVERATANFKAAAMHAADVIEQGERQIAEARRQSGMGAPTPAQPMQPQVTGSMSQLEVNFPPDGAPPPAFANVSVVHRFPEYLIIDFGSIDPLKVETVPGGQKALLQHVGRLALPESAARSLLRDLARVLGAGGTGG